MSWSEIAFWALVAVLVLLWAVWRVASRLDRLHRKVAGSRVALDALLVRRASAALELASSGALDPASALVVADAAYAALNGADAGTSAEHGAMDGFPAGREDAESNLSATLREALGGTGEVAALRGGPGETAAGVLAAAWYRATLARRFHNEAVTQACRMRRRPAVRWMRLAGRAPVPRTVELDDRMPEGLDRGVGEST